MRRVGTTFVLVFITWLILTFSLNMESVIAGIALSLAISVISRHLLSSDTPRIILHPVRWLYFLIYIAMMFYLELLAHLDVASRVFTGRIRPAIVEVPSGFNTSLGKTLMANSITMTPGTLTVSARHDKMFYVHTICYHKNQDIGSAFRRFVTRVIG